MPSTASDRNHYHVAHHRKHSSQSQSSLPDQVPSANPPVQSPNRSLVYLPSAAYSQPDPQPPTDFAAIERSQTEPSHMPVFENSPVDPRDFYRPFQESFPDKSSQGLHQDALVTSGPDEDPPQSRRRKSSAASAQSQDSRGLRSQRSSASARQLSIITNSMGNGGPLPPKTLTSRKASFRDLIARFDASPDDAPPLPPPPGSFSNSRKNSPVVQSNPHQNAFPSARKQAIPEQPPPRADVRRSKTPKPRLDRPLFGEVLSSGGANMAGYGIVNARRRRGSEGSPMQSPKALGPEPSRAAVEPRPIEAAPPRYNSSSPATAGGITTPAYHRRANSDMSSVSAVSRIPRSIGKLDSSSTEPNKSNANRISSSKIPVSTRRQSLTSDSGPSNPSSRAASKLENHPPVTSYSRTVTHNTQTRKGASRQRDRTPAHIQSPGQHGRHLSISQGEKSPSLRANIIAPPPKISPPLRGSRQRLPVSSATTASSRARMAEKFQAMAREQIDKKSISRRPRPPELTDIDFDARRLKITQALSKSREEQDLRGQIPRPKRSPDSHSASAEPSETNLEVDAQSDPHSRDVPALVIQSPDLSNDGDVFQTPTEDMHHHDTAFTESALRALGSQKHYAADDDSPTLGTTDQPEFTGALNSMRHNNGGGDFLEPVSAFTETTADTLPTPIDNEPQVDEPVQNTPSLSLLTQVKSMREQDSNSPASGASHSGGVSADRTDAESVHLFLRNTTYDMDMDEAIEMGYRDFIPPPVPKLPEQFNTHRSSWTSSIAEHSGGTPTEARAENKEGQGSGSHKSDDVSEHERPSLDAENIDSNNEVATHSAASDAYTIVNIVVQEQSSTGVVDQQLVDHIYQQILGELPEIVEANSLDEHRIVELCLLELDEYQAPAWTSEADNQVTREPQDVAAGLDATMEGPENDRVVEFNEHEAPLAPPKDLLLPPKFQKHTYKSSLDSAEDWADTSPSVGDWAQFALSDAARARGSSPLIQKTDAHQPPESAEADTSQPITIDPVQVHHQFPGRITSPPPRAPSHSPPPPPVNRMASIEQVSLHSTSSLQNILTEGPQIPDRLASLSQTPSATVSESREQQTTTESIAEDENPEQRRLRQRRHVLKEIVDTEFTYERDLRVLCDIYQQTAKAALAEDDVKTLFGNVDVVQNFAKDFLTLLKQNAKPAYVMERPDRRRELTRTPTSMSDHMSIRTDTSDLTDSEKDRLTKVGYSFETSMADMEEIYKEYIRSRHAANQRLAHLQSTPTVRQWLKECSDNSSDITNAWSLDALLVKPIQRITKYPLLLTQLLENTPADHPDYSSIRRALNEVTDINIRINEVKKHTEIMDQVLNRKRKESDVRAGLTKAFGRRAEKLRQHVGINEMFEDGEYARLKMDFDNNGVHLLIVSKDCQGYIDAIRGWVVRMVELAATAEAWLDVGHSNHPEAESKLRQLAMAVKGISSFALPDHTELVMRKVIQPMEKALVNLEKFKTDPKGLLMKREKKLLDYGQAKNKRDRGEKIDRKMTERMEQWEAINVEAKERMRKLLSATGALVQSCLAQLVQLHMTWLAMLEQKLAAAMAIPIDGLEDVDLVKEWQVDFDFQHAFAMSLSICNGTLMAEAMNLMSFLTPGSTLNGEDSPRPSWQTSGKRSISVNSDGSHLPESGPRYSGQHSSQSDYPPDGSSFGQNSMRNRATSMASGRTPHTPDLTGRSAGLNAGMPNGYFSRPGTSPGRTEESSTQPPRVSLDAPSPSLGAFRSNSPARPGSASTFFSAAPGPSNYASQPASGGSSIFSSAMPLSDSPETERHNGKGIGEEEPEVLFTAASVYEFNIDRARQEGGIPYLTYVAGEIFDVIGERGELWLARNQDDANRQVGWIWNKHFAKLAA